VDTGLMFFTNYRRTGGDRAPTEQATCQVSSSRASAAVDYRGRASHGSECEHYEPHALRGAVVVIPRHPDRKDEGCTGKHPTRKQPPAPAERAG
jgi:hypothetical protein